MANPTNLQQQAQVIADQAFAQTQAEEDRKSEASDLAIVRRTGGGGTHLTPAARREIALAYLSEPELGTVSACARHFNHTREAIAGCLKGEEYEQLRRQVELAAGESAKRKLKGAVELAADAWVKATGIAAEAGNHKPAKDLLVATRVIEPAPTTAVFYVGQCVNNVTTWSDPSGNRFTELPADAGIAVCIGAPSSALQLGPALAPTTPAIDGVIDATAEEPGDGSSD